MIRFEVAICIGVSLEGDSLFNQIVSHTGISIATSVVAGAWSKIM